VRSSTGCIDLSFVTFHFVSPARYRTGTVGGSLVV